MFDRISYSINSMYYSVEKKYIFLSKNIFFINVIRAALSGHHVEICVKKIINSGSNF